MTMVEVEVVVEVTAMIVAMVEVLVVGVEDTTVEEAAVEVVARSVFCEGNDAAENHVNNCCMSWIFSVFDKCCNLFGEQYRLGNCCIISETVVCSCKPCINTSRVPLFLR